MAAQSTSINIANLNFMKKVPQFQGKSGGGQSSRSWPEWRAEFMLNANLCGLHYDHFYPMVQTLLESSIREAWLRYTAVKPESATWVGIDVYMDTLFATKDKSAEAEQRFQKTLFKRETDDGLAAIHASQSKAIADMAGPKRRLTDAGLWDTFLGNLQPVAGVHNLAYTHYVQHQLEFDQLDVQGRINKIIPVVAGWITTLAAGQTRQATGHGQGQAIYSRPQWQC